MDKYNLWHLFEQTGDINSYMSYKKKINNPMDSDLNYSDFELNSFNKN